MMRSLLPASFNAPRSAGVHANGSLGHFALLPRAVISPPCLSAMRAMASTVEAAPLIAESAGSSPKPRSSRAPRRKADKAKRPALQQLPQRVSVMPGVGLKYEQLMRAHNIRTVSDLMKKHVEEHGRQMERTEQFLKEQVGINNAGCLRSITEYLGQKHDELKRALQQEGHEAGAVPTWLQPKVTLSVEGNISAGKSTFLRILEGKGLMDTKLQVVPEPVEKWQSVGPAKVNLLMEFYKAPERFAYTFQNYVFLTRMIQERESYTAAAMCRLLERSIFSDKMVFVRAVHAAKLMNDTELEIYNSWFDPVLSTLPTLVPNGFIYLRATPQTCHNRLKKRAREEETSVTLDYLQDLHAKHEDWLWAGGDAVAANGAQDKYLWLGPTQQVLTSSRQAPPMSNLGSHLALGDRFSIHSHLPDLSAHQQQLISTARLPEVPKELDRAIRFLDTSRGEHMHPLLHTIPALVIDCETDVDVERDEQYKTHVADQVSKYCDYVRQYMVARGNAVARQEQTAAALVRGGRPEISNGYNLQVNGTTLYLDSKAPLLAYATREGRELATAQSQGVVLPDAPRTFPQTLADRSPRPVASPAGIAA